MEQVSYYSKSADLQLFCITKEKDILKANLSRLYGFSKSIQKSWSDIAWQLCPTGNYSHQKTGNMYKLSWYVWSFLGVKKCNEKPKAGFIPMPVNDICKEHLWVRTQSLLHSDLTCQPRSALELC